MRVFSFRTEELDVKTKHLSYTEGGCLCASYKDTEGVTADYKSVRHFQHY